MILTFFTPDKGKIATIAKYAKKSVKRFAGILELFSVVHIVCRLGRKKGLPVLTEATLQHPFDNIRSDVTKMAYASYWAEIINTWMENNQAQAALYALLYQLLGRLDHGRIPDPELSILFQLRFLKLSGFGPNLKTCARCDVKMEDIPGEKIAFDLSKGGILCGQCRSRSSGKKMLSKGVVKQLQWVESGDLSRACRIRFNRRTVSEALDLLESFLPFHLGKAPRSLKVLQQIRK